MKHHWIKTIAVALFLGLLGGPATASELSIAEEILGILRDGGQINEQQYDQLVLKAQDERERLPAVAASNQEPGWFDRIKVSGDIRARYENFWFDRDPLGVERDNRHRLRYRARIKLKAKVNDRIDAVLRFASGKFGGPETDSRNQTVGEEVDFGPDGIFLDQAYLAFHPFEKGAIPGGGRKMEFTFGKIPNPFKSKIGKDMLLWDGDLTLEGGGFTYAIKPSETLDLVFNSAYVILDEETSSGDPQIWALQLTGTTQTSAVEIGGTVSYYKYDGLNSEFFARSEDDGTIPGGLSDDSEVTLGDLRAWLRFNGNGSWPLLVYGNVVQNFSAESVPAFNAGDEDLGWGIGFEIGDKKKFAQLGAAYFRVEANAVPGNITDSDLFDGHTNREGWLFYGTRQLFKSTDLKFTLFVSDEIEDSITHPDALETSERTRLQTDIVVKF
jgi:hypothetical protein